MPKIKLTNSADIIRAQDGHLAHELIRSIEIEALVNTGATTLILPADVVAQLGFTQVEGKKVRLADGSPDGPIVDAMAAA